MKNVARSVTLGLMSTLPNVRYSFFRAPSHLHNAIAIISHKFSLPICSANKIDKDREIDLLQMFCSFFVIIDLIEFILRSYAETSIELCYKLSVSHDLKEKNTYFAKKHLFIHPL